MPPPEPFRFLSDPDIDRILEAALAGGARFAEIFIERKETRRLRREESRLRAVAGAVETGAGIRALSREGTGYAYTSEPSLERLLAAAAGAGRIASGRQPAEPPFRPPPEAGPSAGGGIDPELLRPSQIPSRDAYLQDADRAARCSNPSVTEVSVGLGEESRSIYIANSLGTHASQHQVLASVTLTAYVRDGSGRTWRGHHGGSTRDGFERLASGGLDAASLASEAVRRALVLADSVEAPTGELPVVIGNGWGGVILHEAIGHGFEADFIRRGTSLFTGRVGEKVASGRCTVVDDGSIPGKRGSFGIDDEGTASGRTELIRQGVLTGYLHDLLSADALGMDATGNGRRHSFRTPPIPRQSNLYMEAGESSFEEILRAVPRGLYAKGLGGGQVDIVNGNFVFEVTEGYLIEEGRLTAPVRGANLIGSGRDVLTRMEMVGSDFAFDPGMGTCGKDGQSQPVGVGQPTILVSALTVGGTRL
jgi:TldD protein